MRTIENSKVGLAGEKYSPYQTRSDDGDRFNKKLSGSPQPYEGLISNKEYSELFRISDEKINLEAKNLLRDSGCFLPDSEEDETSLESGNGTRSEETTDPDSEGQDDDGDLDDAEGGTLKMPDDDDDDLSASHNAEDSSVDSCEMTYIELDLSSQNHEDLSDDVELMMKNLQIGSIEEAVHPDSYNFDSSDVTPTPVDVSVHHDFVEKNDTDSKLDEIPKKQFSNPCDDVKGDGAMNSIHSTGDEYASSNRKPETTPKFLGSFLPSSESSLGSLSEKTYMRIAERLLDEQTLQRLNAEENISFNSDSCGNTLDIPFVPSEMESSNEDVKSLLTPDETDPAYKKCPMTYVDLYINEPCPEDLTLQMFNNLNIKDDKIPLRRGNPSDQNAIQTRTLCSEIDVSDFEVPSMDLIDDPPFLIDKVHSEMDFNSSFTNGSSMSAFYSSQTFPPFGAGLYFDSTFSNDCITKTFNKYPEVHTVERLPPEISSPRCSILPPVTSSIPVLDSSFDESFFGGTLENGETPFEHKFVTENLDILEEINEFLGLSNPDTQTTLTPPASFPPLSNTVFSRPPCLTNLPPMENPFPPSLDSNVIPRVTAQTLSTQSEATPAVPNILFILSTTPSIHGLKRPTCNEMSEPAKKPFGFDNFNNSSLSEDITPKEGLRMNLLVQNLSLDVDDPSGNYKHYKADLRKKAKEEVESLTDKELLEFTNNESCLHKAVKTMNTEYVLLLLKKLSKLDSNLQNIINSKNDKFQTPLHLAVETNIPAIVHLLIRYGAEVNHLALTPSKKLESPLHYVASRGYDFRLVLKCLLKATDLDINIKNSEGRTALLCAAVAHGTGGDPNSNSINSEYIIKKLLKNADPLIQDNNGKNVLMYAIESKDLNLVKHMKTVCRDQMQELLTATSSNGQTCQSLAYSLKEQFTQSQWEKLVNLLTCYT